MSESFDPPVSEHTPAQGLASAIDWWREAGVDWDFAQDATVWLAPPESEQKVKREEQRERTRQVQAPKESANALERALRPTGRARIGSPQDAWPKDLAAFRSFWMEEPSLTDGVAGQRVAPVGDANAPLMVLVAQPDENDTERLLAGTQGQVLQAIMQAAAISEDQLYLASALPQRVAMPDWQDLARRGLSALTQHHVKLANPQNLLVLGRNLAGVLGCEDGQDTLGQVPLMIAPSLENLARSAGRRERFWNQWLDWTA